MYNLFDTDRNVPVPLDPLTGYAVRKELFDSPPLFSYYSERILIDILDDYLMEKHQQYQKEITDYFIRVNKYDCNFSTKQKIDVSYPSSPIVDFDIEIKIPTDVESYLFLFQLNLINNLIPAKDHPVISRLNINENLIDYYYAVPIEIKVGNLSLVRLYGSQGTSYIYSEQYTLIVRNDNLLVFSREFIPAILFKENKFSSNHYAIDLDSRSTYKKVYDSIIRTISVAPYYFYPIDINFSLLDKDVKSKNIKISSIVPLKISTFVIRHWPINYEKIRTPVFAEVWIRRKGDIDDLYEKTSLVYNGFEKFFIGETEYDTVGFKVSLSKDLIKKKQDAEEIYLSYGQSESKRPLPFYRKMEEHHFDFYQTPVHPVGIRASISGMPDLFFERKSDSLDFYIEKVPTPFSFRYEILKELVRYNMLRMDLDVEWKCFPLKIANSKEAWRYNVTFYEFLYGDEIFYKALFDKHPVLTSPNTDEGRKFCIFYVKPNHLIVRSADQDRVYIYDPQCCYDWYKFDLENSPLIDSDKWPYFIRVDYEKDYNEILCDVHDKESILYRYLGPIRVDVQYYLNLHGGITFGSIEPANYDNNWLIYYGYYGMSASPLFLGYRNDGYVIGHYTEYVTEALIYNNEYLIIGYSPLNPTYTNIRIFKLGQTYDIGNIFLTYSLFNKGGIRIYSKLIKNGYIIGEKIESFNAQSNVLIAKEQKAPSGSILLLPEYGEQFYKALVEIAESTTLSCTVENYLVTYLMLIIEDHYEIGPYIVYKYAPDAYAIAYRRSPVRIYRYYLLRIKQRRILKWNYDSDAIYFTYEPEKKKINAKVTRSFKPKSPKRIYNTRIIKTIREELIINSTDDLDDYYISSILRDYKNFDLEDTEVEIVWSKTFAYTKIYPLELLIEKARESNYEVIEAAYLYHYKSEYIRCCSIASGFSGDNFYTAIFHSDWPISVSNEKPVLHINPSSFTDYIGFVPPISSSVNFLIETDFDVSQNDYTINEQKFIRLDSIFGMHIFVTILIDVYRSDDNSVLGSSFAAIHHYEIDNTKKDFQDIFINIEIRNRNKYGDIISIEQEANFYDVIFFKTVRF